MRRFLSLVLNEFISLAVIAAGIRLLYRFNAHGLPEAILADNLDYLKYFTVLSNLLMGLAAGLYALAVKLCLCHVLRHVPGWVCVFKYVVTVLVSLTFVTVLCYIGPRTGFRTAYRGANLWFHLILPLAAVLDFTVLYRESRLRFRATSMPLIPIAIYGTAYILNLLFNGFGGKGHPNDWYGFAAGRPAASILTFSALIIVGWLLALALWLPHKHATSNHEGGDRLVHHS